MSCRASLFFGSAIPGAVGIFALVAWNGATNATSRFRREAEEARREANQLSELLTQLEAFMSSADGGVLLEQVMRDHPRLKA